MANEDDAANRPATGAGASEGQNAAGVGASRGASVSEIERKLMIAAEELGTWLGTAERKTAELLGQQGTIAEHLVRIRDTAARLLAQIEKGRERSR